MSILNYGKEIYLKGRDHGTELEKLWPKSWQITKGLFICLNESHPCCFDVMEESDTKCRFCSNIASDSDCIKVLISATKR